MILAGITVSQESLTSAEARSWQGVHKLVLFFTICYCIVPVGRRHHADVWEADYSGPTFSGTEGSAAVRHNWGHRLTSAVHPYLVLYFCQFWPLLETRNLWGLRLCNKFKTEKYFETSS